MDHFSHHDGRLWCEQVALEDLARRVGTPAYVYSARTIRDHASRLKQAFSDMDPLICYATKANGCLAVLQLVVDAGLGLDIVSGGELERARTLGVPGERVVFSGVAKTVPEMRAALEAGVLLFNVESEHELAVLEGVARELGRRAPVGIRVNPDVDPKTHRYITTGKRENKFGVDLALGEQLARRAAASPHLRLLALQCHIGSQITSVAPYAEALGRVAALAARVRPAAPDLTWLDMGGGFGIYYNDRSAPGFAEYAAAVRPIVKASGLRLLMEPGRVLVGNAGALLTTVQYTKQGGEKRFVIVDAGMNDLLRPSLYDAYHRIWPARGPVLPPLGEEGAGEPCDIVGPVCESGDFLARERPFPVVERGEVLAVLGVGAYGFSMASTYNDRPRPCEVLVDGSRFAVVRERETYEDLLRNERPRAPWQSLGEPTQPESAT